MSILIDKLVQDNLATTIHTKILDKWWIAKPLASNTLIEYCKLIKDVIRILKRKSFAVHYKEDE